MCFVLHFYATFGDKLQKNKKVLLCERKRHTARHIAITRYADLSPDRQEGYPIHSWIGWGTSSSLDGYGHPHPDLGWGYPLSAGWSNPLSRSGMEYLSISRMGYPPPRMGYPLSTGYLGQGTPPPSRPGMGYPPSSAGWGYPPPPPQ